MKLSLKSIYLSVLGIIFSGCADLFFSPTLNLSLPPLQNIKALPDVSSVAFEWNRVENEKVKGYVIYRKDSSESEFERIAIIRNPRITHFYDSGLKSESVYQYQFATLGEDDTISVRSKAIAIKTSYIDPIEFIYATSDEPRLIKLIWNPHPNPSIKKYIIEKLVNNKWEEIGEVDHRLGIEFFDTNLSDGVTYEYRVAGVSFQGDKSRYSQVVSATTKFPPDPLSGVSASLDVPKLIILKWNPLSNPDIKGYIIYASRSEKGGYKKIGESKNAYFELRTEENGERWFFKVVAVDKSGIEGVLPQVPVMGSSLTPPERPKIKGAEVVDGKAVIGWEMPSQRVSEVFVFRKEGTFGNPLRFRLNGKSTQFVDKEMQKGVKYTYWVEFVDVNQIASERSQEFTLSDKE